MNILNRIKELQTQRNKTERCVVCYVDTSIPLDMHIDLRLYYVEGAGQLCKTCYDKVYQECPEVNWKCSICGKDTSKMDYHYLSGTDHLSCVLEKEKM